MAIAMRLRNQLQSVYKLDPLRNEVSGRVVRARLRWAETVREVRARQRSVKHARCREIVVVSAALMERRARATLELRGKLRLSMRGRSSPAVLFCGAACGN